MKASRLLAGILVCLSAVPAFADGPKAVAKKAEEPVGYYREVRRVFQQHCQGCHQPAKSQGGFVMTSYAGLLEKANSGEPGLVPGKPEASLIVSQITPHDGKAPA